MKQLLCILLLITGTTAYSHAGKEYSTEWTREPFDHRVFIENKGQFDSKIKSGGHIFFSAQLGKVHAYFTAAGVTYRYDEQIRKGENEKDSEEEREGDRTEVKTRFVSVIWENCNASAVVSAEEKQPDYYTYADGDMGWKANIFKKIICKNIYKGIDIEYFFPDGDDGIKYNVVCHAGSDQSMVRLTYKGAENISLEPNGDVLVQTKMGNFTEHAPVSFYNGNGIPSAYQLDGRTISFSFAAISPVNSGKLVVDPWVSNPLFTATNNAVDLDFDDAGNVYAGGSSNPFQIVKFNSSGTKLWTYNVPQATTTIDYGCFAVDKTSGSCYFFKGWEWVTNPVKIFKISSSGNLIKSITTPYPLEFWRAKFDRCNHKFIVASGGWSNPNAQVSMVDTNLSNVQTYNPLGIVGCCFDASLLAIDPAGTDFYLGMVNGTGNITSYPYNSLTKLPIASPGNAAYIKSSGYHFSECAIVWTGVQQCGFNGIAASPGWLYLYDGSTLKKFDKNSGTMVSANVVNPPKYIFWQNNNSYLDTTIVTNWGGLDADMCDNVYAGDKATIKIYNSSLALLSTLTLPDTVYDVRLHHDFQRLYACGQGFVTCINLTPPTLSLSCTSSSNCACTGTATANLTACSSSGVQYAWSNGQTTQTATGLCPATYTVTATLNGPACTTYKLTFTDTVTVHGGGATAALANNATICVGQTATLNATGGGSYSWSTGSTSSTIYVSPTVSTSYTVIVSYGSCSDTSVATVTINPGSPVSISGSTTICLGSSATFSAAGAPGYLWSTGSTAASIVVSPVVNSTFTVWPTGVSSSCSGPATVSVSVSPPPVAAATSATVCAGQVATLTASGGGNYVWSNGSTEASIQVVSSTTSSYFVIVSIGTCSDTAYTFLSITHSPAVALGETQMLCEGQSITLDAGNAGSGYLWSNGSTDQALVVSSPGTYWVIVGSNNCLGRDSVKVVIAPSVHLPDTSLCTMSPVLLDPGAGANTYAWSNGSNTQVISVDQAGTYWVEATFGTCHSSDTATVTGEAGGGSLYVPNAFTPNGDHLNETFAARGMGITDFRMKLFDRWGNLIFVSEDINDGWNGKPEGGHYLLKADGNQTAQEDVYIWKINYKTQCLPKAVQELIGHVSLVK